MSNVNNQFKELVNEAIHNHFHDKTETEMILKDWLYGICEQLDEYEKSRHRAHVNDYKAEAFDAILKSYDETLSEEHMADEVSNIIEKYESCEYDSKSDGETKVYKCTCGAKYWSMDNYKEHLTNCFEV